MILNGVILGIAIIVVLVLYMWRMAFLNRILVQTLNFEAFESSDPISLFFISDIHRRKISPKLIDFVRNKADFVIIGGDLREGGVPIERVAANIEKLKEIGPVYFVWGNNDYEQNEQELLNKLEEQNVIILNNKSMRINVSENQKITLLGIEDIGEKKARYDLALRDADEHDFRILISHNPLIAKEVKSEHNIQLVLSGHTHGGQIRFFGIGPYELGGLSKAGKSLFLTSNGYGTSTLPLRLGAKPETHLLTLNGNGSEDHSKVIEL
ncbi:MULTISPECIES: metallophosphoesterase [Bacillaceae]|uniref:MPP superfamily phosphohydrolase n=1 Tax=Peribacillus huizhouensis TaxID=1501239 RepID=A0ABR6CQA1_9BACI|nr:MULTISPECIES: metallophosphoesterase [Bacillaceae]MBA9027232.1 putative MPP superfamily phosphohydrolase [Peribacillus huizhouensis]